MEFLNEVRRNISLFKGETDLPRPTASNGGFCKLAAILNAPSIPPQCSASMPRSYPGKKTSNTWNSLALLRNQNAFEAYLKKYTAEFSEENIVEFLLLNPEHPHSILFSVRRLESSIGALPEMTVFGRRGQVERLAGRLRASLSFNSVEEILAGGLDTALDNVVRQCAQLHTTLHQTYIDYPIESSLNA